MKSVLIVDSAGIIKLSLSLILEESGLKVVGYAANEIEAANLYEELKPDVVIIDISVAQLDGIGALKMIKSVDKDAKIILISTLDMEMKIKAREAVKAGAVAFIINPVKEEVVNGRDSK
jgi:two-component system chemotaxis response regulator CheY